MMLFYDENLNSQDTFILNEIESQHIVKVLRLKYGDDIEITNGRGKLFKAQIIDANYKKCMIKIISSEIVENQRKYKLHIAIAPTKNMERLEWFIEKSIEMGIDRITPIICNFSERKKLKKDRLNKIAIAAMKQSLSFYKPQIDDAVEYKEFVKTAKYEKKFIAYCKAEKNFANFETANEYLFLVGPEGGFSEQEVEFAIKNGYSEIKISNSRLRTETAGIMISSAINVLFQK